MPGRPVPSITLIMRLSLSNSLRYVLIVAAPPDARLVAPPGGAVKPLVHAPEDVQSARIGGIGVVDDAILERERAHARAFARVRSRVGSAHLREGDGPLACTLLVLARLRYPLAYWNELALLAAVAVPLGLWAVGPRHERRARLGGALLLYAALVVAVLTYSRVGIVLTVVAALVWLWLDRDELAVLGPLAVAWVVGACVGDGVDVGDGGGVYGSCPLSGAVPST